MTSKRLNFFHRARRAVGIAFIPDVIQEMTDDMNRVVSGMKKKCKEDNEEYKKRIDEYVDHFMRCKIELDHGSSRSRMRLMLDYEADPFYMTDRYYGPADNDHRRFMAREIAYRVEKEVYSARLVAPADTREFFGRPYREAYSPDEPSVPQHP